MDPLMIVLLALGVGDLVCGVPRPGTTMRWLAGCLLPSLVVTGILLLGGLSAVSALLAGAGAGALACLWLSMRHHARAALGLLTAVILLGLATSAIAEEVSGPLLDWWRGLPFSFTGEVPPRQLLFGVAAFLFVLSSGNVVVRHVLAAAGAAIAAGEGALRGGRLIGSLERVLLLVLVLGGEVTGVAILIAAKGLLRLPELGDQAKDHQVAEYFLIGTLTSLLIAVAAGVSVLAYA